MVIDFPNIDKAGEFINACTMMSNKKLCKLCPLKESHDPDYGIVVTIQNEEYCAKYSINSPYKRLNR